MPTKTLCRLVAFSLLLCLWVSSVQASEPWRLEVIALTQDGQPVETATLTINESGESREQTVATGDTFPVGMVLITLPHI